MSDPTDLGAKQSGAPDVPGDLRPGPVLSEAPATESKAPGGAPRRDFLGIAIGGSAGLAALALGFPVLRYVTPSTDRRGGTVSAGRVEDFPPSSARILLVAERPAIVLRTAKGEFRAFSALCTHLRCVVGYSPARDRIECACHRGVYSVDGKNVSGPPPRPLEALKVTIRDGTVLVAEAEA